jgi:hypothetical protein
MRPLYSKGRSLLQAIVDYTKKHKVVSSDVTTYPTYDQMYRAIVPNAPRRVLYVGHNLRKKGLDDLNDWTIANKELPKVTGLIVDKIRKRPGKGFFPSYSRKPLADDDWWQREVSKALDFDWSPFIGTQKEDSPHIVAEDVPTDKFPRRLITEVSRLLRDTKAARAVKAAHNHFCQICGLRLSLSPGRFYAEGHHLKPLGNPHNGPDVRGNILCLCPNCHVKLDFAAVKIVPSKLRSAPGHVVRREFIDYHNRLL